eukprot:365542-Chlamydomonas_euryale.AAC.41
MQECVAPGSTRLPGQCTTASSPHASGPASMPRNEIATSSRKPISLYIILLERIDAHIQLGGWNLLDGSQSV